MVQLGFYAHMKLALGAPRAGLAPSGPLLFAVAFMLVFSAVIALFKDIPDVKGDRQARPATCGLGGCAGDALSLLVVCLLCLFPVSAIIVSAGNMRSEGAAFA